MSTETWVNTHKLHHHYRRIGFLWWKRYRCMVDGEMFKDREQAEFHCYKANKV